MVFNIVKYYFDYLIILLLFDVALCHLHPYLPYISSSPITVFHTWNLEF